MSRTIGFCFIALFIFSCRNAAKKDVVVLHQNNISVKEKLADTQNAENNLNDITIQVYVGNDTIRFSRKRLNLAQKLIPQFREDIVERPDIAYSVRPNPSMTKNDEEKDFLSFGCEVCQDDYMLMYAYFLKQQNLGGTAEIYRRNFISMYGLINSFYQELRQGGPYFGHQHFRIYAYAEYSVYLQKHYGRDYEKSYAVSGQKTFFIGSLKQLIYEDEKYNREIIQNDKQLRKISLLKKVTKLDNLITNHFYLEEVQKFNYSNY